MRSDEIRKEALSLYSHANVRDRYDADLMMAGFADGAEWADAHQEPQAEPTDAPTVHLAARKGGKTQALIDSLLGQANERGIRVEVVYPQAEPTDAQVQAAYAAWVATPRDINTSALEYMRAALRAAVEVRGEGDVDMDV